MTDHNIAMTTAESIDNSSVATINDIEQMLTACGNMEEQPSKSADNHHEDTLFFTAQVCAQEALKKVLAQDEDLITSPEGLVYELQNEEYILLVNNNPTLVHRISYIVATEKGPIHTVHIIDAQTGEPVEL